MRIVIATATLVCCFVVAGVADGEGVRNASPAVRVTDLAPFTVHGFAFRGSERVTITVASRGTWVRRVIAGSTGRFVAVFRRISIYGSCRAYTVRAVGASGSRAALKFIPECAQP
jgi:hypothetical protein